MDASGYLKKHGWQGSGHSLDGHGRGLKKPLLVSKKVDVLGVGLNKHAAVSDQWWLRAYDQGLATLGTGKESALAQAQKHGVNRGGLYGRFVKGEGVPGTLGQDIWPSTKTKGEAEVEGVKKVLAVAGDDMLPTPQDSDAQEEKKAERKRKRAADKSEEKKSKGKGKVDSEEKAAKKAKKEAKKAAKGKTSGTSTAEASGAEEELDPEKRALYAKRAAEKGVSLEVYIKRRQEKYSAKKDEKRK
jgi:nucleolar protein TMA23